MRLTFLATASQSLGRRVWTDSQISRASPSKTQPIQYLCRLVRTALSLTLLLTASTNAAQVLSQPHIIVSDYYTNSIQRFDASTGARIDALATVGNAAEMVLHNGYLYVNSSAFVGGGSGNIVRMDAKTGSGKIVFASTGSDPIRGFDFGPNGNLYVVTPDSGRVVELDGHSGTYIRDFLTGLDVPIALRFAQGDMFVARGHHELQSTPAEVLRFDATTGAAKGVFATSGVATPQNLIFGRDGDLFVANQLAANDVTKYDGATGARITSFVTGHRFNPQGMDFLPSGDLLVGSGGRSVARFDSQTGQYLGDFITGGSFFVGVLYVPEPDSLSLVVLATLALAGVAFRTCRRR